MIIDINSLYGNCFNKRVLCDSAKWKKIEFEVWFNSPFKKRKAGRKSVKRFFLHWKTHVVPMKLFDFNELNRRWIIIEDAPHSKAPKTSVPSEIIDKVHDMSLNDWREWRHRSEFSEFILVWFEQLQQERNRVRTSAECFAII